MSDANHPSEARRLIEWTGERCVPWASDIQVIYEHYHRYLWAAERVDGLSVLDLGSGEGFGAAILSERAASVVGVDVDAKTVEHSRLNYVRSGLEFRLGDARDLSWCEEHRFDAVIAFEVLEHVDEHERLLAQIRRVLRPGGLLIISTPERTAYTRDAGRANPFHVHELDGDEFRRLLAQNFTNVDVRGQRTIAGSALIDLDGHRSGGAQTQFIELDGSVWRAVEPPSPMYLVAIASDAQLPPAEGDSVLADADLQLLGSERALAERRRVAALGAAQQQVQRLQASLASVQRDLNDARRLTLRIEESVSWRAFQILRARLFDALGGEESRGVAALQWTLRGLGRGLRGKSLRPTQRRVRPLARPFPQLPQPENPDVSIVIPAFNRPDLTRQCLDSIASRTEGVSYEVIAIDDVCDPESRQLLASVPGLRVIANSENQGYLRSVNRCSEVAKGRWLVLANNDVEVEPGWLEALVRCGESAPDIAVVTPKYVSPDGRLSEAGGIVWADGTAANYGRGDYADSWRYGYRRDADYGSAATLLVRADFWRERGGYDERFLPMYYEDTDLCMDAREHGLRVVYEPRALVIHHEGSTAGTDVTLGYKRYQELNRKKFVEKWDEHLAAEHSPPDPMPSPQTFHRAGTRHVLIVDHRVPTADRDSGSLRMLTIIKLFREMGCRVTLLPDNLAPTQPYAAELGDLGVEVIYEPVDAEAELRQLGTTVTLAWLSRPEVASRWLLEVRQAAPSARLIYDTVDLHWLRKARRYQTEMGLGADQLGPEATAYREFENGLVRMSDVTLVVTEEERALVEADVPGSDVRVIPNVHRVKQFVPSMDGRAGLLFVGGFEHVPNVDAALRLVRGVMPLVWATRPDVSVSIIGADPPPEVQALASNRVLVAGWVADLEPLLDSSLAMVAPLSYGAGMKGKVTQAMAAGLPVVTTPIGAEGLGAIGGQQLLIGEDDAMLGRAVVDLLADRRLWERLSTGGQTLVGELCSPESVRAALETLLAGAPAPARAVVGSGSP